MANDRGGGGGRSNEGASPFSLISLLNRRSAAQIIRDLNARSSSGGRSNTRSSSGRSNKRGSSGERSFGAVRQLVEERLQRIEEGQRRAGARAQARSYVAMQQARAREAQREIERAMLEQAYADLQQRFLDQFAVDVPQPPLLAVPSLDSYVKPYDDAAALANRVYEETVPQIQGIYDSLQEDLAESQAEAQRQQARADELARQEQAAMLQQAQALTRPTTLDYELGVAGAGSLGQQQAEADRAFLALRAADEAALAANLRENDQRLAATRQEDAEAMRSGSLAAAKTNLDQILTQIGLGRARAEQQYQRDKAQIEDENARRQWQYAQLVQDAQNQALAMAAEAEQMWADQNEVIAQAATVSPRAMWEAALPTRQQANPVTVQAMVDVINLAGEGAAGFAKAMQMIRDEEEKLASGEAYGDPVNMRLLRKWLTEYYDDREYVDPTRYQQLGGDPIYLAVRQRYNAQPPRIQR